MRKIVVASHGDMARGVESTLSFFADSSKNISYICGYTDGINLETKIEQYLESVEPEDEVIVLTDLMGGSVNTAFLTYLGRPNMHLIAGFNLGLILEILGLEEGAVLDEGISEAVENAKEGIVYVNTCRVVFGVDDDL